MRRFALVLHFFCTFLCPFWRQLDHGEEENTAEWDFCPNRQKALGSEWEAKSVTSSQFWYRTRGEAEIYATMEVPGLLKYNNLHPSLVAVVGFSLRKGHPKASYKVGSGQQCPYVYRNHTGQVCELRQRQAPFFLFKPVFEQIPTHCPSLVRATLCHARHDPTSLCRASALQGKSSRLLKEMMSIPATQQIQRAVLTSAPNLAPSVIGAYYRKPRKKPKPKETSGNSPLKGWRNVLGVTGPGWRP